MTYQPDTAQPPAGWYPDPELANTQRYWDGSQWTEHRAPQQSATVGLPPQTGGVSVGKIVAAIVIAFVIIICGLWVISSMVTANDGVECSIENAERSMDGLPPIYCPE